MDCPSDSAGFLGSETTAGAQDWEGGMGTSWGWRENWDLANSHPSKAKYPLPEGTLMPKGTQGWSMQGYLLCCDTTSAVTAEKNEYVVGRMAVRRMVPSKTPPESSSGQRQ